MRKTLLAFLALFLILLQPSSALLSQQKEPRKPALVLALIVDQMRADYLTRFEDLFSDSGFRLLMNRGADFTNCNYIYVPTYTAPGHSTFLSGILPRRSGIVGNEWFDRTSRKRVYCVDDSTVHAVGTTADSPAGKMSPANFDGLTIGDELLAHSPSSKAIAIAIKDRASILPGGKQRSGTYWFDPASGNWITSTYYRAGLPEWVQAFNLREQPLSLLGNIWKKFFSSDTAYSGSTKDDAAGEGTLFGETRPVFPHVIYDPAASPSTAQYLERYGRFAPILPTPFGDSLTVEFAKAAITGESLGQRGVTDLLSISFSSLDYCGHIFGPNSQEVEDLVVRLDRQIAELLRFVNDRIGLQNVIVVLTGDHGVAPLPEQSGVTGARRISGKKFIADVKETVGRQFGYDESKDHLIVEFLNNNFYLDKEGIRQHGFDEETFADAVGKASLQEKSIVRYFAGRELERSIAGGGSSDPVQMRVENGYNRERSGDVIIVTAPYTFFSEAKTGTTHGSPYEYDTHVPLLFFGLGVKSGEHNQACAPNDISATLAFMLGIPKPEGCVGEVLKAMLKQ